MSWLGIAAPEGSGFVEDMEQLKAQESESAFPRTLMVTSFFAGIVAGVILCRLFSTIHIPTKRVAKDSHNAERKTRDRRWGNESLAHLSSKGSVGPRLKSYGERKMESLGLSWKTSGAGGSMTSSNSFGYASSRGLVARRKLNKDSLDSGSQDVGFGRESSESDSDSQTGSGMRSISDSSPRGDLKVSERTNWSMSMSERLLASTELPAGAELPEPEHHFVATCLFFDIVEFSKACAERSSEQVRDWMMDVNTTVEELTVKHAIRVVECRGDCYICIAGTNFTEDDVWETQLMRMVSFGCDVHNQLIASDFKTRIRIGIAVGPLTIGYIRGSESGALNLVAYGDTINTAARMEQNGKEGMLLMTKSAAHRLCREAADKDTNYNPTDIPVNVTYIKSKGLVDCWSRKFTKAPKKFVDEQNRALRLSWPAGKEMTDRMDAQELLCSYQAL